MPSSWVRAFTDSDEYAAAMRHATVGFTVTQQGSFAAKLSRVDLNRFWMQRFSSTLGWTSHIDYWGGQVSIAFQTQPGASLSRNGREFGYDKVARLCARESYYLRSPEATSYGTVTGPIDDLAPLAAVVGGHDPKFSNHHLTLVAPAPDALANLRRLHETAGTLAEDAPKVLSHPQAARGLEQALIEALVKCVVGEPRTDRAAVRQHAAIMRRFHRVIEGHFDEPLYITELCREIGASERTLFECCQEHLGMGAKHYLLLRRMHLVKRALRESIRGETTVTEIATRYGFWQFGRFAVEYKTLFAEAPSETLARSV
jgi:AraC-like DNA-binding protein